MNDTTASIRQQPTRAGAVRLLQDSGLPSADLTESHMADFFFVGSEAAPQAIVGVEMCGPDALLRSLVVEPGLRAHGLGSNLVTHAEAHARKRGARTIYLLTTTAEPFFRSRGYVVTSRESAPPAVRATSEFSGLCPATSAFLSKRL